MLEERGRGFLSTVFMLKRRIAINQYYRLLCAMISSLIEPRFCRGLFLVFHSISRPDLSIQDALGSSGSRGIVCTVRGLLPFYGLLELLTLFSLSKRVISPYPSGIAPTMANSHPLEPEDGRPVARDIERPTRIRSFSKWSTHMESST